METKQRPAFAGFQYDAEAAPYPHIVIVTVTMNEADADRTLRFFKREMRITGIIRLAGSKDGVSTYQFEADATFARLFHETLQQLGDIELDELGQIIHPKKPD